jgi:hypothetical protein
LHKFFKRIVFKKVILYIVIPAQAAGLLSSLLKVFLGLVIPAQAGISLQPGASELQFLF